jgi:hypothetical protein
MTYRRKQVNNRLNPIQIIPHLDLAKHPTILITDIRVHKDTLRVINFYNDVDDQSYINTLLQLDLDPTVPTMLVGDFNLHSRTWSPQNWERSTKAPVFEQWAASQTFALHTHPGDITRQGLESERPSTLDLTWHNWALEVNLSITPPHFGLGVVSWVRSLRNQITMVPRFPSKRRQETLPQRFQVRRRYYHPKRMEEDPSRRPPHHHSHHHPCRAT